MANDGTHILDSMDQKINGGLLEYSVAPGVKAFSTLRDGELPYPVLQPHQVHSDCVVAVRDRAMTREDLQGVDALVTGLRGYAIGVRTADCVPVLIYDPVRQAIAAVHSGWKGTVKEISARTLEAMRSGFGTAPEDVLAVVGPSIGPGSFQVGEEVVAAFREAGFPEAVLSFRGPRVPGTMQGGWHIDLWSAVRWTLERCGVRAERIFTSGVDTYGPEARFFSARREGISCGRIINSIMLEK